MTTAILIVNAKPISVLAFNVLNVLNVCSGPHEFVEPKRVAVGIGISSPVFSTTDIRCSDK